MECFCTREAGVGDSAGDFGALDRQAIASAGLRVLYADQLAEAKRNLTQVPDDFEHEQATCFNVKGKGLVVMTLCGHRGVVNSVRRAIAVSGVNKVHAVMGGFHLAPHPPEYLRETVAALKEINPDPSDSDALLGRGLHRHRDAGDAGQGDAAAGVAYCIANGNQSCLQDIGPCRRLAF